MSDTPTPDDHTPAGGAPDAAPASAKRAAHAGGFTLDLSSGEGTGQPEAWRRKRKQASPVLTKIVDLTTPKPAPLEPPKPKPEAPRAEPRRKRKDDERRGGRKPGGATLADLLDEATLARLRGEE